MRPFPCGHPRTPENSQKAAPNWYRCRTCQTEYRRERRRQEAAMRAILGEPDKPLDDSDYVTACNRLGGFNWNGQHPNAIGPMYRGRAA